MILSDDAVDDGGFVAVVKVVCFFEKSFCFEL